MSWSFPVTKDTNNIISFSRQCFGRLKRSNNSVTGSVQRAVTYVNGKTRKLKKTNYPTSRVALHNSLGWLFVKKASKTLQDGLFTSSKDALLKKFRLSQIPEQEAMKVSKHLEKERKRVKNVITSLEEVCHAMDHEITMARICEENGFELVQDYEGDDFFSKEALKRVEKLKRKKKGKADGKSARPSETNRLPTAKIRSHVRGAFPTYSQASIPKFPRYGMGRGRGAGLYNGTKPGACYICGQRGHWKRECQNQPQSAK